MYHFVMRSPGESSRPRILTAVEPFSVAVKKRALPNSKTGRDYAVPMNEDVRSTLRQIRGTVRGGGYVFFNPDTVKPYTDVKDSIRNGLSVSGNRKSALA